ncbi:MAG TPA: DoxX family protein [Vicinamibacterales bacterium]|nr:DoxX family protein [Vicinamibacterales bacterium]
MRSDTAAPIPARARIAGLVLSAVGVLFLIVDAGMKILSLAPSVTATVALGYPASLVVPIGAIEMACLALYLWPRTAVVGAVLWTGYLGGAVASQARVQAPLFGNVLFPIYVAVLLWAGLWLRDRRARALVSSLPDPLAAGLDRV